ncbi:kinase-like domain-containing protein [Entophlyctis helioformis]|nr:kinase-like domain-containing protein [Entophlyctis helioformis]
MAHVGLSFTSPQKTINRFTNNIGDYELHEELGKGGFGTVYRATSRCKNSHGLEVAIKMINKAAMKAQAMESRVLNEVEIHWQLHHPSILQLYNYFEDNTNVYLVMELCKNGELFKYIQRRSRPLSEPETRGVMQQLVHGLAYLHSNRIMHRDLKLGNLLLTERYDVKIADFGLASRLNGSASEQKTMCGTPNYISPEIVQQRPYGLSSDVWSLGCLMVTFLTGVPPFHSSTVKGTLDKAMTLDYRLPDYVSAEARDLINRLIQLEPEDRMPLKSVLMHPFFDLSRPVLALAPQNRVFAEKPDRPVLGDARSRVNVSVQGSVKSMQRQQPQPSKPQQPQQPPPPLQQQPRQTQHQQRQPIPKTEVSVSTAGSASQMGGTPSDAVLQPFSTLRLKPIKQSTKHGQVEILANGSLVLDFAGDQHSIHITGDGETIRLVPHDAQPQAGRPPRPPSATLEYTRKTLPPQLAKKYRYASKFVSLVRAKTPKIVFYSPLAKCALMENTPVPDFEVTMHTGLRLHTCTALRAIEIRVPVSEMGKYPGVAECGRRMGEYWAYTVDGGAGDSVLPVFADVVRHAQECLRQCMDVDALGFPPGTRFPVILKSSHVRSGPVATGPDVSGVHVCMTASASASVSGRSEVESRRHGNGGGGGSGGAGSDKANGRDRQARYTSTVAADTTAVTRSVPAVPSQSSSRVRSFPSSRSESAATAVHPQPLPSGTPSALAPPPAQTWDMRNGPAVFDPSIGWCFKHAAAGFMVLFLDGSRLIVYGGGAALEYSHASDQPFVKYDISPSLSETLKRRLSQFTTLVRKLKDQQHQQSQSQQSQHHLINK